MIIQDFKRPNFNKTLLNKQGKFAYHFILSINHSKGTKSHLPHQRLTASNILSKKCQTLVALVLHLGENGFIWTALTPPS